MYAFAMLSCVIQRRLLFCYPADSKGEEAEMDIESAGALCARPGGLGSPAFVYQLPVGKLMPPDAASRVRELDKDHADGIILLA